MITIKRDTGYADILRSYHVVLDGKNIGKINHGQEASFEISHGTHVLQLKIDWCGSNKIEFEDTGKNIDFDCGNNCRGNSLLYTLFMKDRYIWLKRMDLQLF